MLLFGISQFFAQNNAGCPNANFSNSNFSNWQGYTGNYANPASAVGIVNGRHTIITTPGIDPNTWDGKDANGFDITQGTYTWKIILKSPYSDNRKAYVGHLNLLR